jgi:hypothetical protein
VSKLAPAIPDAVIGPVLFVFGLFAVGVILAAMWPKAMTNDEVIAEAHKCEAAGMMAERAVNGWTYSTVRIDCVPPVHKEIR